MTAAATYQIIRTPDDRAIEVLAMPPTGGWTLIFQGGTPVAPVSWAPFEAAAASRGMRLVKYARPGYGGSGRRPGRKVADAAQDVAIILDALGVERCLTLGWSGGGPHALACAALLPARVAAAAAVASIAPYGAEGVDWLAGSLRAESTAAVDADPAVLRAYIEAEVANLASLAAEQLATEPADGRPQADSAVLVGEFAEYIAACFRRGVEAGIWGWYDDMRAFVADWGFDPAAIRVPVTVWHGEEDDGVPIAHGRWLASHIPGARARLVSDHGHLSIGAVLFPSILGDLLERAGIEA